MTGSEYAAPAGEFCYSDEVHLGAGEDAGGATENFLEMFIDYHSNGDFFELVRRGGGNTAMSPPQLPDVLPQPPSEEEMAAWLYQIVRGEEFVADHPADGNGDVTPGLMAVGDQLVPIDEPRKLLMEKDRVRAMKQKCAEGITSDSGDKRKTPLGTRARKSNYSETHSLTEKIRRCKVNERFRILQQLVPGCDKSNQAMTLDRTIHYMKSLQQQVEAMSSLAGCNIKTVSAAYPVEPPPYSIQPTGCVVAAQPSMPLSVGGDVGHTRMVPVARPSHAASIGLPCYSDGACSGAIDQPDAGDYLKYTT